MSQSAQEITPEVLEERRAHPRTQTILIGRYMLPDKREFPCHITDVALGGIKIECEEKGEIGDNIIVYIDKLGRIEGRVIHESEYGFGLELTMSPTARNKWAERLEAFEPDRHEKAEEKRVDVRIKPENTASQITLPDGRTYTCEVIDVSVSGASIKVGVFPAIGTPVALGKMNGRVARHHDDGIAIEFDTMGTGYSLADRFQSLSG